MLNEILSKNRNNFVLLRLLLAWAVIYGHSFALSRDISHTDVILRIVTFDYSGSLAVKTFFMLSGLLVINSAILNPDLVRFLISRFLRIYPGLFVCLLVSIVLIGPAFTRLDFRDYVSHPSVYAYLFTNLTFKSVTWRIPGVFDGFNYGLNGSLWTISLEAICYGMVVVVLGLSSGIRIANIVSVLLCIFCVTAVVVTLYAPLQIPYFGQNPEAQPLLALFCIGGLMALFNKYIYLNLRLVVSLWLLQYLVSSVDSSHLLFYTSLFVSLIYIFTRPYVLHFHLTSDVSYGVYLYGFPIQQCIHYLHPEFGAYRMFLIAVLISTALGYISWKIVEEPAVSSRTAMLRALEVFFGRVARLRAH